MPRPRLGTTRVKSLGTIAVPGGPEARAVVRAVRGGDRRGCPAAPDLSSKSEKAIQLRVIGLKAGWVQIASSARLAKELDWLRDQHDPILQSKAAGRT